MNSSNSQTKLKHHGRKLSAAILLVCGAMASMFGAQSAHAVLGQCKDTEIKFVNSTGLTITIPREGHKVKNPGGLEGWNNMTTGGSVNDLANGKSTSVAQTLNIKCVNDAADGCGGGGLPLRERCGVRNSLCVKSGP